MISKNYAKKIEKKQKRCQQLISNDINVEFSTNATSILTICNAGLSTGLKQELLIEEITKYCLIKDIIMIPGKSYCFLVFNNVLDSCKIYDEMNGKSKLGQDDNVLILSYTQTIPDDMLKNNPWNVQLPNGLIIIEDFITEKEENDIMNSIDWNEENDGKLLKHRQVKHFGYEFLYGSNNIDVNKPLDNKIPSSCDGLWKKLKEKLPDLAWYLPDQMTANKYEPGQGIPPHVDTHSAFWDPILSLSLNSDVVMEFRSKTEHANVRLKRRSLLLMSNEARLGWTHGITPRMTDILPTINNRNGLTIEKRSMRVSLTFRKLKFIKCECDFKHFCDSYLDGLKTNGLKNDAARLELENVHKVYNQIGDHFSETRHSPWPRVELFINSLQSGSILCDIGCGNGKYLSTNKNIFKIGCDRSKSLLNVCQQKHLNIFLADCLNVPLKSNSIDACISIAVIHHLASAERRLNAIKEMSRILVQNGKGLIYVWAKNQKANNKKSSYLRQNKKLNKQKAEEPITDGGVEVIENLDLPIHTNRTEFKHSDILVPWKLKENKDETSNNEEKVFLRFYHVFEENELIDLCKQIKEIEIVENYYDQGNWCIIFKKI